MKSKVNINIPSDFQNTTVLVVDDNPKNLGVVADFLERKGLSVSVAGNGEMAIKRARRIRPDLILLDIMMPGIDGFETCRILKNTDETSNIPVLFMTALDDPEHKVSGFSSGAVDYITKPIQQEELLARVSTHLRICKHREYLEREVRKRTNELEDRMGVLENEILERRRAEDEIQHLRNYLSSVIDSMPSILIGVDADIKVTFWNRTAKKRSEISADNAQGRYLPDVFPHIKPEIGNILKSIETKKIKKSQKRKYSMGGSIRYDDFTIYPLIVSGEEGAVIRIDDVTEQVRMEEMMVQSEKMLSVGGLAAGMAHEINNPLAGMMQSADVMRSRLGNTFMPANLRIADELGISMEAIRGFMEKRDIFRMLDAIHESGCQAAEIIRSMLSFARKTDADISSHYPDQLMNKILELAATDYDLKKKYDFKTIEIVKQYEDDLPMLFCEGVKIQQVLLNIFRNGAQAMQDAETASPKFIIRIYFEEDPEMICMEIEDNGPGMDEKTRLKVFEPFFTTKPVGIGTGLGLSVSYFIITESHRGTMDVISQPGKGANFIIRLPLKPNSFN